jgi:archaemetzincin
LAYVVLHELGHNYGLEHCTTPHCMMKDAQGKGANIENEPKQFCKKCRKILN